ncbi:hypothetical protein [Microbulbifer variabilis]|uniref:hypothetical protein n=1 Tax=Microbulbifer variabilis TaxID=266805 RepID=UPI0012FAD88A|nr:hypothetical protein [Microbulbifer variabilis]
MSVRFHSDQLFYHGTNDRFFAEGRIEPAGQFYLSTSGFESPITANTRYIIKFKLVRNVNAVESRNIKRGDVDETQLIRDGGLWCSVPDAGEPQVLIHWETAGHNFEYVSWSFCWWSDRFRWVACCDRPAQYGLPSNNHMV